MDRLSEDKSINRYYCIVFLVIIVMFVGLGVLNPRSSDFDVGFMLHIVKVVILSVCLLLYPKYRTHQFRILIVIAATALFYLLLLIYPNTGSGIVLICLIPTISILLFDIKLFYYSIIMNALVLVLTVVYIYTKGMEDYYPALTEDLVGNFINFFVSQIIIFFAFYLTYMRIKKQQQYYEQLKHSERLKTTGELAAATAHEIRNPLTVVKGYLQMYEQDNSFDVKKREKFSLLIEELDTAEQVITQLLSLSKPTMDNTSEKINVKTVIQSVTDLLQSYGLLNKNNINVYVTEDCTIAINKMEFNQLLVNIIKNAIEASSCGDSINVFASKSKNYVEIKVSDVGLGMSTSELESIGTPFYSLKAKGTGLGVMICNQIVANYSGTISYESNKGKGTTVTICFPCVN